MSYWGNCVIQVKVSKSRRHLHCSPEITLLESALLLLRNIACTPLWKSHPGFLSVSHLIQMRKYRYTVFNMLLNTYFWPHMTKSDEISEQYVYLGIRNNTQWNMYAVNFPMLKWKLDAGCWRLHFIIDFTLYSKEQFTQHAYIEELLWKSTVNPPVMFSGILHDEIIFLNWQKSAFSTGA